MTKGKKAASQQHANAAAQNDADEQDGAAEDDEEVVQQPTTRRVPKFRPFFMQTPDSRSMVWETWYRLFIIFLEGEGINDDEFEKQRLAAFYCGLGAEGARICAELCPENVDFDETVRRLKQRFGDRQSQLYNRSKFHQRGQLETEDILAYVTELRQLASRCGYGATEVELIRDRLLAGCRINQIREKLLLESDTLTLTDALKVAQTVERALQESGELGPTSSQPASLAQVDRANVSRVRQSSSQLDSKREQSSSRDKGARNRSDSRGAMCNYCGWSSHSDRSKCPALGKTCSRCGRKDHFACVCRSGYLRNKPPLPNRGTDATTQVRGDNVFYIQTVASQSSGSETVIANCGGGEVKMQVDIGAQVSVLNHNTYRSLPLRTQIKPTMRRLHNFDGGMITVLGTTTLPVSFKGKRIKSFEFFVVPRRKSAWAGSLPRAWIRDYAA